jgi:hypothetical protein
MDFDAKDIDTVAHMIYEARLEGSTLKQIGERFGLSQNQVVAHYKRYMTSSAAIWDAEDRRASVQIQLERLDALFRMMFRKAMTTEEPRDVASCLQIMAHRDKLLGLDQQVQDNASQIAQILVVGTSQQDFIEALNTGRQKALAGSPSDDEVEMEVEL